MEGNLEKSEKKLKPTKQSPYTTIPIRKETKKKITVDLTQINKERLGRHVRYDEYLALAVSLITKDALLQLKESVMTHADRLERDYRAYVAQFGPMEKDLYLGKRLN